MFTNWDTYHVPLIAFDEFLWDTYRVSQDTLTKVNTQ